MFGGHRKIEKQRKSRGALADPGPCDLLEILELCSGVGERWILLFPKLRQGPGCGFVTIDDSVECDRAYRACGCPTRNVVRPRCAASEINTFVTLHYVFQKCSKHRETNVRLAWP